MIPDLISHLEEPDRPRTAFIGLDGFVDEIIHVVDKRFSPLSYERIKRIKDYADRIERASAMSTNIELVSLKTKMGGNGPILTNALLNFGVTTIYMGSIGTPPMDPIMEPLRRCKRLIGLAQPAHTDALEFEDGKIIASKLTSLDSISWESIRSNIPMGELVVLFQESDLIAFSNWSMILGMNGIWEGFLKEIAPQLDCQKKVAFFDLADPEKRSHDDLRRALTLIKSFAHEGFRVLLSLNLKEAFEVSKALELPVTESATTDLAKLLGAMQEKLEIGCVIVHPIDRAACLDSEDHYEEVRGPYCEHPILTTGAGDNFNAGFLYGVLQSFHAAECLLLGCATSGYYVRYADSPTKEKVITFLSDWEQNRLDR